jgi:predicted metallopeptidase
VPPPTVTHGFDFTLHMRRLCDDMVRRLPELHHVDLARVAVSFCQARKPAAEGLYASLTPLRFAGGRTETVRRGRRWGIQRLVDSAGREMLYILNFYLPRFMDLALREKLATVLHELLHIGPRFDGDLRRFRGRCYAHGGSRKRYDALAERLAAKWASLDPPQSLYEFLREDFLALIRRHGRVFGQRFRAPKLLPL